MATDHSPSSPVQGTGVPSRTARTTAAISSTSSYTSPDGLAIGTSASVSPDCSLRLNVGSNVRSMAPLHDAHIAPSVPVSFAV